jgi:hypothetical protein
VCARLKDPLCIQSNEKLITFFVQIMALFFSSYTQKAYFSQMLCTNLFTSLFVSISPLPLWHIKKLIKQHDHYTGAPCAGDNKRPL